MDNLNDKYEEIVTFLKYISEHFCKDNNITLRINIPSKLILNASVRKIRDKEYYINIYPGCLNLYHSIECITDNYNEDDLKTFFRFEQLGIFERHEKDTYRDKLNNLFATVILLHIFWHEIGHIYAGHVDSMREYFEFTSSKKGCYSKQEQEMVADWISTKQVFKLIYGFAIESKVKNLDELITALKQLVELYWITLTIEFQIFDSIHIGKVEDFSTLNHPHPSVRLLYSIEAILEALMDIFNSFGLDDAAEEIAVKLVNDIYCIILSFLQITDSPIFDVAIDDKRTIECYITLRELPYSDEYEKNVFLHLDRLSDSYKENINKFLHR